MAKRSGITVEEFAIGFPPRMVKVWQDEGAITLDGQEYVIGRKVKVSRTIQTGGQVYAETAVDEKGRAVVTYLEPIALDNDEEAESDSSQSTTGSEAKVLDAMSFNSSKATPIKQNADRPTLKINTLTRPTEYSINMIPLGGYVRMVGEEDPTDPGSFARKSKRVRLAVLAAGSLMNILLAVVFFTLTAMSGMPEPQMGINNSGEETPIAKTIITQVVVGAPADEAGIQSGDIVVGDGETAFEHVGDLIYFIQDRKGSEVTLLLERDGENLTTTLVPRVNPPEGQGSMGVVIAYDQDEEIIKYPIHKAFSLGVQQTANSVVLPFFVIGDALRGNLPMEVARPTGPVGIYQQTDSVVDAAIELNWWSPVLLWTAILSTALAVTNLLPLPALDGGRILFILIEAVRGKRISPEKEGAIHFIGLALLLTLVLVISYYDFSNPLPTIDWNNPF